MSHDAFDYFDLISCHDEQLWNREILNQEVMEPIFRLWRYHTPGIVLGCNQKQMWQTAVQHANGGADISLRMTGGGAVLVGPWMLSLSVALPNHHPFASNGLMHSYRWLSELTLLTLQSLGIECEIVYPEDVPRLKAEPLFSQADWACYGGISSWEITSKGKKIVGLSQARKKNGVLLAMGILTDKVDWASLVTRLDQSSGATGKLEMCTTSCSEQLGRKLMPGVLEINLVRAIQAALDLSQHASPLLKTA